MSMNLKPLYRSDDCVLVGLNVDFQDLCVLDGLVVEVDLNGKKLLGNAESGLRKLRSRKYTPIRQEEKKEYTRLLERRLKRKLIRRIEEILEFPEKESVDTLAWIPDRLSGNGKS